MAAQGGARNLRPPGLVATAVLAWALAAIPWQSAIGDQPPSLGLAPARFLPKEEREAAPSPTPADAPQRPAPDRQEALQPQDTWGSDAQRADAALADVCFVDRQRGWAVGDRGAIWHTRDGGRTWMPQRSGVSCRLESVCFVSAQVGWAAGGFSHPYTHTGSGVLLFTDDGGDHWNRHMKLLLPPLVRVRFFGPRSGGAIGFPSALFSSGIFTTETGARTWEPVPGERARGPQIGDFLTSAVAAVYGRGGPAIVQHRQIFAPDEPGMPDRGLRRPLRLALTGPNGGWLVGQGGLVLRTADQGARWHAPPGALPTEAGQFDLRAVEVRGPNCWIAGYPGTRVFFTPDAGRTWSVFATGQSLPLEAICFADEQCGWAVGQLGTILATVDGGRTWMRQRCGGARAALLGVFSEPRNIPWELFARLSGNEGYLAAVELVHRRDVEVPCRDEVPLDLRAHEAVVYTGACAARTAWQFPLRQPGLELSSAQLAEMWDGIHDGRGLEALEAHLVRAIRTWRPDVIVTQDATAGEPGAQLLGEALLKAVAAAGAPDAHREQLDALGLGPWQVKRMFAAVAPAAQGALQVTAAQWAERLGRSLGDVAAEARALVCDEFEAGPASLKFQPATDRLGQEDGPRDFFARLVLPPGSEARRMIADAGAQTAEQMRRLAQQRRSVQAILERSAQDPRAQAALLAEVRQLIQGLDPPTAAAVLYQLAQSYSRSGSWPLAAEVLELLCEVCPQAPLSRPAQRWLVHYYASSEARWRLESPQRYPVQQAALSLGAHQGGGRGERALTLGNLLQQTRPDLFTQPAIGFPLAAVQRQWQPRQAERFYAAQRNANARDAWWACAQGEQWLSDPRGKPAKAVLHCRRAAARPYLDGKLDDAVWKEAEPALLHSPLEDDSNWPAKAMLASDREFLYIAVEAREAPTARYEPTAGPRPRDADLASRDRVELYVDLDRDYATYYRLAIDHRGWTAEDCWGDATWNPKWFVAAESADGSWTAEAAIPLDQLTGEAPQKGTAWAIGIQRIAPGAGFQSWNTPAAVEVIPEGFGFLLFE